MLVARASLAASFGSSMLLCLFFQEITIASFGYPQFFFLKTDSFSLQCYFPLPQRAKVSSNLNTMTVETAAVTACSFFLFPGCYVGSCNQMMNIH